MNQLNKLVTTRRKMILTMNFLNIKTNLYDIGEYVKSRNSIAAHGSTGSLQESTNLVLECMKLSKLIISKFILGKDFGKAYLDGSIKL